MFLFRCALLTLAASMLPVSVNAQYAPPEQAAVQYSLFSEMPSYPQPGAEFLLTSHGVIEPVPDLNLASQSGYKEPMSIGKEAACYPQRYVQVDGLIWHRVGTGCNQVLALDTDVVPESPVLSTNDLNFDLTAGPRVLVGWRPACPTRCSAWELSYFGLYDWQASGRATGDNNLAIPGDLGLDSNNFQNADAIEARYRSNLHNIELNCVKSCCQCDATFDFLTGFRFIYLDERFSLFGDDRTDEGRSSYDIDADNFLFGLQMGGRYTRHWNRWSLQLSGKAGVFLNHAEQSQRVLDDPVVEDIPFELRERVSANGHSVAALGELGIVAIRPINDVWSLRLGYTALGLGGVALAPGQLDFSNIDGVSGTGLNRSGWVFLHGGLVGLEANW
ncbi:MAG: BBP7 family outer membrane beta-barrel protein [Pirellulaceae bacterium]|nr:BBP7 family outer membrane beta-barrel protein [Pirellulaceae bacterium]